MKEKMRLAIGKDGLWKRSIMIMAAVPMAWVACVYVTHMNLLYILAAVALVSLGLFLYLKSKAQVWSDKSYRNLFFAFLVVYFVAQVAFGIDMQVELTWDFGHVHRLGLSLARQGTFGEETNYLEIYPNNAFLTLLLCWFYRIVLSVNFLQPVTAAILLNAFVIDITLIMMFFILRRLFSARMAFWGMMGAFCFLPLLGYMPIAYSDTISLPFVVAPLWLEVCVKKGEGFTGKRDLLCTAAQGALLGAGYHIKATVFIVGIALLVGFVFWRQGVKLWQGLLHMGVFLLAAILFIVTIQQQLYTIGIVRQDQLDAWKRPASAWVNMGLRGKGGYSHETEEEQAALSKAEGYAERDAVYRQLIVKKLEKMGPGGYLSFLTSKTAFTWTDGTYFFPEKLKREPVYEFPSAAFFRPDNDSAEYHFTVMLCNIYHTVLMLGVFLSYAGAIQKPNNKIQMLCTLSITGLALLLLVWETRSRYLFHFYPLMLMAAIFGYRYLAQLVKELPMCVHTSAQNPEK